MLPRLPRAQRRLRNANGSDNPFRNMSYAQLKRENEVVNERIKEIRIEQAAIYDDLLQELETQRFERRTYGKRVSAVQYPWIPYEPNGWGVDQPHDLFTSRSFRHNMDRRMDLHEYLGNEMNRRADIQAQLKRLRLGLRAVIVKRSRDRADSSDLARNVKSKQKV